MQTAVTVVNLIHDTATETDRPVCWVFPGCSWRECRSTSGSGTAKDPERTTHIRIPASVCTAGYLPYAQWAALSAAEKGQALDPETRLEAGAGRGACLDRSRVRQTRKKRTCAVRRWLSRITGSRCCPTGTWKGADTMSAPVFDFKITFRPGFQADMDVRFAKLQFAFSQKVAATVDPYVPFLTPAR